MAKSLTIRVQEADYSLQDEYNQLRQDNPQCGAIVTFCGLVRDINQGDTVNDLMLEHYPGMTEAVLQKIASKASARWDLQAITLIHRIGKLHPLDQIVFVGVASAHRGDAFAACEYLMDFLKTQAPFWKKESTPAGDRWVEAKSSDDQAAQRWELE